MLLGIGQRGQQWAGYPVRMRFLSGPNKWTPGLHHADRGNFGTSISRQLGELFRSVEGPERPQVEKVVAPGEVRGMRLVPMARLPAALALLLASVAEMGLGLVAEAALGQQFVQVTVCATDARAPRKPSFVGCGKFARHWYVPRIPNVAVYVPAVVPAAIVR